jgi:GTP pyrophosphokinase
VPATIEQIEAQVREYNPDADLTGLDDAYHFAFAAHEGQVRKSGEPFVKHPIEVCLILAELHLDTATLKAALLHDVVEDSPHELAEVRQRFGDEVAELVDGVTKLGRIEFETLSEAQSQNLRKMLIAMAKDIRVILIKLADRLHNMRTLSALPPERRREKAVETMEIYAPLAHRLGISSIKWELEDLSFYYLEPRKFHQVQKMVAESRAAREAYLRQVIDQLQSELREIGVEAEIAGRPKHLYSIYQKMSYKGKDFNEIYDLIALRVIVDSVKDVYGALGTVHSIWKPVPGRFKDYVAMPKFNMYQSLHTTVIGPAGRPLEIQIRTEEMHRTAEYGIAAHWRYKEGGRSDETFDERLLVATDARVADRAQGPARVHGSPQDRSVRGRGLRLHAQGRCPVDATRFDAHRLRVRHPHGGRPPLCGCEGERCHRSARLRAADGRPGRDPHKQEHPPEP